MNEKNNEILRQDSFILTQNNSAAHQKNSIAGWNEDLQICFCTDGEGYIFINGKGHQIKKGQFAVIPPQKIYCLEAESKMIYASLVIVQDFCKNIYIDSEKLKFPPVVSGPKLYSLFLSLIKTENDRVDFKEARQSLIVLEMINELLASFLLKRPPHIREGGSKNVKKVILYISENFSKKISLNDISEKLKINKFTLAREFKAMTNKTIFEYINIFRCLEAEKLIKNGLRIKEAAKNCGFNNFSYFTKTFKKIIGITPKEYRDRITNPF